MPDRFLNLSACRFVALDRLPERREALHRRALACNLRGTVLLAAEGINLFVAGPEAGLREWLGALRQEPLLAALEAKESWSDQLAMRDAGLDAVYQLDGGVLRYFEQLPDAPHWQGRCFVFDGRETLGPDLAPAAA